MKKLASKILAPFFRLALFAAIFFASINSTNDAYAGMDGGVGRTRSCAAGSGDTEGLVFDPTNGGKDVEFVLTNPVCAAIVISFYAAIKITISAMNGACGTGSVVPRVKPSPISDFYDIGRGAVKAAQEKKASCIAAVAATTAPYIALITELGVIYLIAKDVYDHSQVCGSNWRKVNPTAYDLSADDYKQTVKLQMDQYFRNADTANLSLSNQTYREWYYNGIEVEDNPDNDQVCYDVTKAKDSSGTFPKQKYYLRGTQAGNFNCKKYYVPPGGTLPANLPSGVTLSDLDTAYKCCQNRSQNYICIDYYGTKAFCKAGSRCTLKSTAKEITFSTKTIDNGRLICAETYSLCPYNFTLQGGSEYCDYYRDGKWDSAQGRWKMITGEQITAGNCSANSEIRNPDCTYNAKAGKCQNYCQYLKHCTVAADTSYHYKTGLNSPYFSEACLNFEGDSQNKTSFNGGIILGSQKHFSAPLAQCVKESFENLFYNRAGHSSCASSNEYPQAGGICASGLYATDGNFVYKKGNFVERQSLLYTIQDNLRDAVKMVLTLSIVFYGMNLLLLKANIGSKKDILVYILKIALVLYFATGDAWQTMFFNGVYGASDEFAQMVFKIQTEDSPLKRDGCQFGNLTLSDGSMIGSGITYPPGKEYLAIWDTLDCKTMRYLGFGPEASEANIASLIIAAYFTGSIGLYFALSVMIFGIFLICAIIRALHIFLASALSIMIFVFISPITITAVLFNRTKGIFDAWLKDLISFCLQPMLLFAYIAIFVSVMDKTLIGSAIFLGDPPSKTISCAKVCKNSDGTVAPYVNNQAPACDRVGQYLIDPLNDSVACLINVNDFGKFPGFEIIGVSVPILINLFNSNVKERVLTLLKGALVMYLLYKFMDEIPGITSALIGGTALPPGGPDAVKLFQKMVMITREIQKRAAGAAKKMGGGAGKETKGVLRDLASRGKSTADADTGDDGGKDEGADSTASSGGGGATQTQGNSGGSGATQTGNNPGDAGGSQTGGSPGGSPDKAEK